MWNPEGRLGLIRKGTNRVLMAGRLNLSKSLNSTVAGYNYLMYSKARDGMQPRRQEFRTGKYRCPTLLRRQTIKRTRGDKTHRLTTTFYNRNYTINIRISHQSLLQPRGPHCSPPFQLVLICPIISYNELNAFYERRKHKNKWRYLAWF